MLAFISKYKTKVNLTKWLMNKGKKSTEMYDDNFSMINFIHCDWHFFLFRVFTSLILCIDKSHLYICKKEETIREKKKIFAAIVTLFLEI